MKLLDPFAGYRLASGHPFFHAALFLCSWFVTKIGDADNLSSSTIKEAFNLLRWAHFILIILAAIQSFLNSPSKIPEVDDGPLDEADEDAKEAREL